MIALLQFIDVTLGNLVTFVRFDYFLSISFTILQHKSDLLIKLQTVFDLSKLLIALKEKLFWHKASRHALSLYSVA